MMGNPALAAAAGGGLCCTETDTGTESGTGNRKTKNVKIGVRHICVYINIYNIYKFKL